MTEYEIPREIILDDDDKKRIFPKTNNLKQLRITDIALFSTTPPVQADFMMSILMQYFPKSELQKMTITDANACIGGNTYSMLFFNKINFVEISTLHVEIFKNNLKILFPNCKNVSIYNDNYINIYDKLKQDIVFLDPPWGGIDYRKKTNSDLYYTFNKINKISVKDLISKLSGLSKLILLKVPYNYDINLSDVGFQYVDVIPLLKRNGDMLYKIIVLSHTNRTRSKELENMRFQALGYKYMNYKIK